MRYIKKYEYFDKSEEDINSFIITLRKFIRSIYPEVESFTSKKHWVHSTEIIIVLDNIETMNIERFNRVGIKKIEWLSVDESLFNITIRFKDLLDYEVDDSTLCQFLINIFKKYQKNNNHNYIFVIEHKDIQNVIDEITSENYELFSDAEKYNL